MGQEPMGPQERREHQADVRRREQEHPLEKGKKGHGQGGQSGQVQGGQNMQKRDGRH